MIRILIGILVAVSLIIFSGSRWRWHPFFSLLAGAVAFGLFAGIAPQNILTSIQSGFGALLQQIGMLVAIGSVMGSILEKTGAMESLGIATAKLFNNRVSLALILVGLVVGVPVFCDSGFIVLSRLIPTLSNVSGTAPGSLALSLSTGLYTSHTLVPPTPGPLAAASNLGLGENLGLVILVGFLFSIPVIVVSYFASNRFGKKIETERKEFYSYERLPNVWKALLPLLVPVLLITLGSFAKMLAWPESLSNLLAILGAPAISLSIGLILSFLLVDFKTNPSWPDWVSESLKDAGIILLITGAGGAFGAVIKQSEVEKLLGGFADGSMLSESGVLLLAFLMAAILKTAQGSTTSSMIITSSIVSPVAAAFGFVSVGKLILLLMAIGGGAMSVSHANDSYFWVISRFGGIRHTDLLKSYTVITLLQGLTVLITAVIAIQFL